MSEISRDGSERFAKMLLPDPIRHRTEEKGIVLAGEPLGKGGAVRLLQAAEEARDGWFDLGAGSFEVATNEDGAGRHAFRENTHAGPERLALFRQDGVIKEGTQAVKVGLADGIVRVVVALRAADGEPESDGTDGAGDVIQQHMAALGLIV